jgi:hypothetical protein
MLVKSQLQKLKEVAACVRSTMIQTGREYGSGDPICRAFSTHFFNSEGLEIGYVINGTGDYYKGNTFYLGMSSLDPESGFSPRKWHPLFWDDQKKYPFVKKELIFANLIGI